MPSISPSDRRAAALAALAGCRPRDPHPSEPLRAHLPGYVKAPHKRGVWNSCGRKAAYPTQADANIKARAIFASRGVILRAYQCDYCGKFHLTKRNDWDRKTREQYAMPLPTRPCLAKKN